MNQISVILPTFNRSELLRQCLAGFASQTIAAGTFEVVVVDDGSIPPVRHVTEEFAGRLEITYLYQPNAGLAAARNAAILAARAPLLVLHDDDDEPVPDYLERCLDFHNAYPDEADILLTRVVPHKNLPHTPVLDWVFDPENGLIGFPDSGSVHDHWKFYGGTSSCKRSLYRFGLYDPEYRFGLEDMELAVRLSGVLRLRVHYDGKVGSYLLRSPEFAGIFRRSYVEGRSYRRFHSRHGDRALPILRPEILDAARTINEIGPIVPQLLESIRGMEAPGTNRPDLQAAYRRCAAYARAQGWIDYGEEIPEKRGLRRIDELLGKQRVRDPQRRSALVYFPYMPYPAHGGAQKRCLSMLRALRRLDYRVDLLISTLFTSEIGVIAHAGAFERDLGIRLHIHDATPEDRKFQVLADKLPWERLVPPDLCKQFKRIYWETEPELTFVNYAEWAAISYDDDFDESIRIIDTHDLVTVNQAMRAMLAPYFPERPVDPANCDPKVLSEDFFANPPTADDEEFRIYDRFDLTIAIAAAEADAIRGNTRYTRVLDIPMTFEVAPALNRYDGAPVFVIADNLFNIQGYVYFVRRVLTFIQESLPSFSLRVVGPGGLAVRAVPGIELAGIADDLASVYMGAAFAVCPLLGGTGLQVKIVEAMAHGVPVVALGALGERSPIQHGVSGFIAANAREFAEYCLALSKDRALCRKLGQAARETVEKGFSPAVLESRLSAAIQPGRGPERDRPVRFGSFVADQPQQLAGRRIVIFGSGAAGQNCLRALTSSTPVIGFVDNDPAKDGRVVEGLPIRSPESLRDRGQDLILVTGIHWAAITQQLIKMGFQPGRDFRVWTG